MHRCRPDLELAFLAEALRRAMAAEGEPLAALAGRRLFFAPQGRDALSAFLRSAGIGPGDEVAVPTLICEAVADGILASGARPVTFGNSSRDFGPSLEGCERALSRSTKAVIVPHLYGIPADLKGFRGLCASRGILLVEDCAPCIHGEAAGGPVGSVGDCALYSFKYDKPLALGWGGALSLSPEGLGRTGPPEFPTLSADEDRVLAASLLAQHALTDSARLLTPLLSMSLALERFLQEPRLAEGLLSLVMSQGAEADIAAWCERHLEIPRDGALSRARRWLRGAVPPPVRRWLAVACGACAAPPRDPVAERLGGKSLPTNGLCSRLLAAQERALREGTFGARRAKIAAIYASRLDPERFIVPPADPPPAFWLRFPVALRPGRAGRDRLAARIERQLGAEIGPYNWPTPLHLIPRLRGRVRSGPGSAETERLVAGLLNLPVHAQVTEALARDLADALNRTSDA